MRKLIITNGTGGAGKDTFYQMVANRLQTLGYDVFRYSYVQYTRDMLSEWGGIDTSAKTDKDRQLLACINHALEEYSDIPFRDCCEFIDENLLTYRTRYEPTENQFVPNDVNFIFLDVRVPEVIDRFKERYQNTQTVFVHNGEVNSATAEDRNVYNYKYDYVIDNTGNFSHLKEQAERYVNHLICKNDTVLIEEGN